ncbi:MAG: orotidine-5'-phosphate decarboxylase [Candidatus Ancaeobacter aquaticus]|nr:orotidine-5'-phosphate decarboxylase [Candidatus Ancaeobacter aquaticus]
MKGEIIIALDVEDISSAQKYVKMLKGDVSFFKIGSQLFTSEGADVVKMVKDNGCKVFLDLKFHDIPHTVRKASESATALGVDIFNVHTSGGTAMMREAVSGAEIVSLKKGVTMPSILGVTCLTSLNDEILKNELNIRRQIKKQVVHLAKLAKNAGLNGVVASAQEIRTIRRACGKDFIILTPGIRPEWSQSGDQKRTMTPIEAIRAGSDYLVIGRPVLAHSDPKKALKMIIAEIETI